MTQNCIQITVNVRDGAPCLSSFEGLFCCFFGGCICGGLIHVDFVALYVCLSDLVTFFWGEGAICEGNWSIFGGAIKDICVFLKVILLDANM